jgi:Fur family ferric uptake transcriptional regulator
MTKMPENEFESERAIFEEHIRRSGLRRTAQRDLILDIFLKTEDHLTSEDLYWLVQKEDPSVGQTTVYRTLKLLTEAGLAREVRFGDGKTYYEHHYNHDHHDHLICTECGKVIEFFSPEIEEMQERTATEFGFRLTNHSLRMWGVCAECQVGAEIPQAAPTGAQPRVKVKTIIGS